jgi:hypothetical protein
MKQGFSLFAKTIVVRSTHTKSMARRPSSILAQVIFTTQSTTTWRKRTPFSASGLVTFTEKKHKGVTLDDMCNHKMTLYPTLEVEDPFHTAKPWVFFALVLGIFVFTALSFYVFHWYTERNFRTLMEQNKDAVALVPSIF